MNILSLFQRLVPFILVSIFLISSHAQADIQNYTRRAYVKAYTNGDPILLDFHASWCPTCRQQAVILDKLAKQKRFSSIQFMRVNYDRELKLKRQHKVKRQSTLVLIKGQQELGRLQGVTNERSIVDFLNKALYKPSIFTYSDEQFKKANDDGKTVVLDFHASWCPTCRKQSQVIKKLLTDPMMANVVVFRINYDTARGLKREHRIRTQSTLLVFKNGKELARSVGKTDSRQLKKLFLVSK